MVVEGQEHLLLDVRTKVQFAVCALDHAVNIPLAELEVGSRVDGFRPALATNGSIDMLAYSDHDPGDSGRRLRLSARDTIDRHDLTVLLRSCRRSRQQRCVKAPKN